MLNGSSLHVYTLYSHTFALFAVNAFHSRAAVARYKRAMQFRRCDAIKRDRVGPGVHGVVLNNRDTACIIGHV